MHYKFPDTTILYEASSSKLCVLIDFESRDSIAEKKIEIKLNEIEGF